MADRRHYLEVVTLAATLDSVNAGLPGWKPSPKPTVFWLADLEDSFSPPSGGSVTTKTGRNKRRASSCSTVGKSASPDLKRGKKSAITMRRTPQQNFTQPKLTSMLQKRGPDPPADPDPMIMSGHNRSLSEVDSLTSTETVCSPHGHSTMDTSPPQARTAGGTLGAASGQLVTTDFLLRSLKENTNHIINTFNASLGLLAQKVGNNAEGVAANKAEIQKHAKLNDERWTDLQSLASRVTALERGAPPVPPVDNRAVLSSDYLKARRSIRIWPIPGDTEPDIWGGAGEFLHHQLAISTDEVGQEDVEEVQRVVGERLPDGIKDEVVVVFKDPKKRDLAMVSSVNLSKFIDPDGKPTAGTRLEIPDELSGTFRLLSRFGTRLRARHGQGTKRHIKFDDYQGSLYAIIKLPGDTTWTKVTPSMAREDLESSIREEQQAQGRRMAAKLIPGPRERLSIPMIATIPSGGAAGGDRDLLTARQNTTGKRPRWSGPLGRPPPT